MVSGEVFVVKVDGNAVTFQDIEHMWVQAEYITLRTSGGRTIVIPQRNVFSATSNKFVQVSHS